MRLTQKNVKRNSLPWILPLTFLLLISLLSSTAGAVDYYVWGRVYSASVLTEGEEEPNNPLDDYPDEQIIGDDMFAVTQRNMVKVKVIKADDGSELGNDIVCHDGGYFISFNAPSGGVSVRFIVEELATSNVLLDSDPNELSPWPTPNIRFLLVPESVAEIGDDREFYHLDSLTKHTGIFTRIGKVEVETKVGTTTYRLIGESTGPSPGLVNVPQVVSDDLHIPKYQNAPFGGNLYMFGAFDQPLYGTSALYRIKIEDLDTPSVWYMDDPLVKTKYTVDLSGQTPIVDTERVTLGPKQNPSNPLEENCYEMTDLSTSVGNVHTFWSFPDLLALWRSGGLNGKHKVSLELVNLPPGDSFVHVNEFTDLTVSLDNIAPKAEILPLKNSDYDTPRVYTPGAVPGDDLTGSLLEAATFPANYGGMEDPTCMILNIESPPDKYLAFKLTGYHANGYLRYWHFWYERNDNDSKTLIGKKYDGITDSMVNYPGTLITSGQTNVDGFENMFLYVSNGNLAPSGLSCPASCAYRFVIRAATRTTDGYNYLRWAWDDDIHYLLR